MIQLVLLNIKTTKPFWQILEFKYWLSNMLKNWYAILIWLPANRVTKNNVNLFSFFVCISKFEYEFLVNQVPSQKTLYCLQDQITLLITAAQNTPLAELSDAQFLV